MPHLIDAIRTQFWLGHGYPFAYKHVSIKLFITQIKSMSFTIRLVRSHLDVNLQIIVVVVILR